MNGIDILLDSNIVIDLLAGLEPSHSLVHQLMDEGMSFGVSQIARIERLSTPELSLGDEAVIRGFLAEIEVFPISREVEGKTIFIRRLRKVKIADAIIAATVIVSNSTLLTNDDQLIRLRFQGLTTRGPRE